jgi:hypothetical protein
LPPTITTLMLVIFGLVFVFSILLYGQILMVLRPHSQKTKDLLIGKGENWRDKTHFRFSVGSVGVLFGTGGDMFCGLSQAAFQRISVSYFGSLKKSMFIRIGARLSISLFIGARIWKLNS